MSNAESQLGWFYMLLSAKREVLCYRCNRCTMFSMLGDGPQRVWCCNRWATPPKETFWGERLPRVPYIPPRAVVTLPGNDITFTD